MPSAKAFFTEEQREDIRRAIAEAEKGTTGEIRVHVVNASKGDPVKEAERWFGKLKMHEAEHRHGILFFLAVRSKQFAVYGDKGIHEKVGEHFWNAISEAMKNEFSEGKFTEGLLDGIYKAGKQLKQHFPREGDDVNELPDEITFG